MSRNRPLLWCCYRHHKVRAPRTRLKRTYFRILLVPLITLTVVWWVIVALLLLNEW